MRKDDHYDAEIQKLFPNYNIARSDRDITKDAEDPHKLKSRGGCMVLTSPDIIMKKELSSSNGNCEVLIIELMEEKKIVIVVYNPPKTNFSETMEIIEGCFKKTNGNRNSIRY